MRMPSSEIQQIFSTEVARTRDETTKIKKQFTLSSEPSIPATYSVSFPLRQQKCPILQEIAIPLASSPCLLDRLYKNISVCTERSQELHALGLFPLEHAPLSSSSSCLVTPQGTLVLNHTFIEEQRGRVEKDWYFFNYMIKEGVKYT